MAKEEIREASINVGLCREEVWSRICCWRQSIKELYLYISSSSFVLGVVRSTGRKLFLIFHFTIISQENKHCQNLRNLSYSYVQGSRWTFQATRMNGETFGLFTILPDQMQVANPVLILLFIPLFDYVVYPLLRKHTFLYDPLLFCINLFIIQSVLIKSCQMLL